MVKHVPTLGDIAGFINGDRSSNYPSGSDFVLNGIPFINAGDIDAGGVNSVNAKHISREAYDRLRAGKALSGDILFCLRGSLGKVGRFSGDLEIAIASSLVIVRARKTTDPLYLYYLLQGPSVQGLMHALDNGSAQPNLSVRELSRIAVSPVTAVEQCAIASVLGALDDKIELNRKMSATLQAVARALFKSWFVDFDPVRAKADSRDPGLPAEIAALFPDSFEETARGAIPSGWRVGGLGEVAKNKRNGISQNDITEGTPYIGLEHMPRRSIALDRWGHAFQLESNKSEFQQGNMLFGKLRPYFHKVGIAPVDGVCSTDILVVSATSAEWSAFVLMHLSSDALVAHTDRCSTGTKMPRASWDHICSYKVALPPIEIARMFTAAVVPMTDRIIAGIHESRTLAALRDTLLPKLISGELRVTDAKRILAALA